MALGTWQLGILAKFKRIYNSNLSSFEKDRLNKVLEKIEDKAKGGEYSNRLYGENTIDMFGTGFMIFREGKITTEDAKI